MTSQSYEFEAVIIGGGFYGAAIAVYLAKSRGLKRVILIEREPKLLKRASYNNQARVHNGYHYPRSFTTAFRSRVNLPRFISDWPQAINSDFVKLYAIARKNSKVTAKQFERFCNEIGAKIAPADEEFKELFEPRLIENVFIVEESAFDATKLASWAVEELTKSGVKVYTSTCATSISRSMNSNAINVGIESKSGEVSFLTSRYVFNCTYSGLNQFAGDFKGAQTSIKQEVAEMALMRVPKVLRNVGVTLMDGPFFSLMPFPDRDLHTLSHVRYTPHFSWRDELGINPYKKLEEYGRETRVDRMVRDAGRYLPYILKANYVESLFEVKTILMKNEGDDGRPILFEKHVEVPGCYSILGGKIDNIYDVLERLEDESF